MTNATHLPKYSPPTLLSLLHHSPSPLFLISTKSHKVPSQSCSNPSETTHKYSFLYETTANY